MSRVLVVGGANMDISGRSAVSLTAGDSHPGAVTVSMGGVGRNIAHNLTLLGVETQLLTALGDDTLGRTLRKGCREAGIGLDLSLTVPGGRTGTYLCILDEAGDMVLAVNDMAALDAITPDVLADREDAICSFDAVVADANLPEASLVWLAEHVKAPLIADPVSLHKCERLRPILGELTAIKPNKMEAEALGGISITDENSIHNAADALLRTGLRQVYISMGMDGIFAKSAGGEAVRYPCPRVDVASATGGGDAMVAAITAWLLEGESVSDTARAAICAGAFACTAATTIHPGLSRESIAALEDQL